MNELRDLLRDGAPSVGCPDLTAIRERSVALQNRRRRSQLGVAVAAVALVGGGVLMSLSGTDDSAGLVADQPAPTPALERETAPPSLEGDVSVEAEIEGGTEGDSDDQAADGTGGGANTTGPDGDAPAPRGAEATPEPGDDSGAAPERWLRFEDLEGDTSADPRVGTQTRAPEPQLDILAGELIASPDTLTVVTTLAELESSGPPGANGGYYQTSFDYATGGTTARVVVDIQRFNGSDFIRLDVQTNGTARYDECRGCSLLFDASNNTVTGVVPFEDLERALTAQGVALGPDAVASAVVMETGWVNSTSTATDCKDSGDLRSLCASYSAAGADVAQTPEALHVR